MERRSVAMGIAWVLVAATVLGQIVWVLVDAHGRITLTQVTVITMFSAVVLHAVAARGSTWALRYVVISTGLGWVAEFIGTRTGWPFGDYAYTDLLGPMVLGVPVLIPLAWAMVAYPFLLAIQALTTNRWLVAVGGGVLLAAWDLFLDPQMVGEGYWVWHELGAALPGIPGIPVQNYLGWFLVAVVLMASLDRLPRRSADDRLPAVVLAWTYASNVLAAAVFFGRPLAALWGAIGMGIVVIPWGWRIWRERA